MVKKRVLVIDDEKEIAELVKDILVDIYDVFTIYDPANLFDYVGVVYPDLILMDVKMPGMAGDEALAYLRERGIKVPIILYSATYRSDDMENLNHWAIMLGGQAALAKPFDIDELLLIVDEQIKLGPVNTA